MPATAALAGSGLFRVMAADQLQQLAAAGQVLTFAPGEAIVREGESGDCLYQLRGRVEVLKAVGPGRQVSVRQLGPGEHFGEMTLLLNQPRSATLRALEECRLLQLDRQALAPLLEAQPELLEQLAEQVNRRRQELDQLDERTSEVQNTGLLGTMRRLFEAVTCGSPAEE